MIESWLKNHNTGVQSKNNVFHIVHWKTHTFLTLLTMCDILFMLCTPE
jgi:hypothetical protein